LSAELLLATDLSARCDRAFDRAVLLAREWGARLTVAVALETRPEDLLRRDEPSWRQRDPELADAEAQLRDDLAAAGATAEMVVRRAKAADLVSELASTVRYDLIVTGIARSSGLLRSIMGGTVEALLRARLAPLLVVKQRPRGPYRRTLVGVDFSADSRAALQAAARLFPQSAITVLHAYRESLSTVGSTRATEDLTRQDALIRCTRFVGEALPDAGRGIACLVEPGHPEDLLNQYALDKGIDLLAVGSRGDGAAMTLMFGATCAALNLSSRRDILIAPVPGPSQA